MDSNDGPKRIGPNSVDLEIIKAVLKQHDAIIQMNSELIRSLAAPIVYMPLDPGHKLRET